MRGIWCWCHRFCWCGKAAGMKYVCFGQEKINKSQSLRSQNYWEMNQGRLVHNGSVDGRTWRWEYTDHWRLSPSENRLQKSFIGKERSACNRHMGFFHIKQFQAKQFLALGKKEQWGAQVMFIFSVCALEQISVAFVQFFFFFFSDFDLRNPLKRGGHAVQD